MNMPPDFPRQFNIPDIWTVQAPSLRVCSRLVTIATMISLAGCAVGPDYQRPSPPAGAMAASFKEVSDWKTAAPGEVDPKQPWWNWYGDPQLNLLVGQANVTNPSLQQAAAQLRQAEALIQAAQAGGLPTLGLTGGVGRALTDSNGISLHNSHNWSAQAGWEPDLWGHVSRAVESAQANAQASAADLAAARLALQAALVNDYLQLRVDDALLQRYADTISSYEKSLKLTESQHRWGVATSADVALSNATLHAARAQAKDVELARSLLEHALAALIGKTPSEFSLVALDETREMLPKVPSIPEVIPSVLLERRPDIASAERRVAVANANIGVAKSAWFPKLALSAAGGNSGPGLGNWLAAPFSVWALGAQLAATLFDGGLRSAQGKQAQAAFEAAAANYRQTVLSGFQEVEDNLAALNDLAEERAQLDAAVLSSKTAERVLISQYRAGTTNYSSVIVAQALTLSNERSALQARGRQLAASVALIKATGGGWLTYQD